MKIINFGKKPIEVVKNRRSKYMRLRVTPIGEIKLTVPHHVGSQQISEFLSNQKLWLDQVLSNVPIKQRLKIESGSKLQLYGQEYTIRIYEQKNKRKAYIDENARNIILFTDTRNQKENSKLIKTSLVEYARKLTQHRSEYYANLLNTSFKRISIREQRSRWGSCSSKGNLNFNWKIILAPVDVFNYVIAHEIAHLREHNHSNNFWSLVRQIHPTYIADKRWLQKNASQLEILS